MASAIDICNLALANLGDDASVASIDPPEATAQAAYCARFYPMARDALLEMHDWNFATRRATPALIASTVSQWQYSYEMPSSCLRVIAVLPPGSTDDYSAPAIGGVTQLADGTIFTEMPTPGSYQTQPFAVESLPDGNVVIYTNQQNAEIRYTARITDAGLFPPLVVTSLGWLLSSYLAGPMLKGDVGQAEAKRCQQMFGFWYTKAVHSDVMQSHTNVRHNVPWITNR